MGNIEHLSPDDGERIFAASIKDMALAASSGKLRFTRFLDGRARELALAVLKDMDCKCTFFGGYEDAVRVILCLSPDYIEGEEGDFPITPLRFTFNSDYKLSHRDFLGVLMAQGLKREAVGDILVGSGEAAAFVLKTVALPIISEVTKIGSVGVTCEEGLPKVLPQPAKSEERIAVVSSMRLDAIVAALSGEGREASQRLVLAGSVKQNDRIIRNVSQITAEGDSLTIRGFGKFNLLAKGAPTKKGKLRITFTKYL